MEPQIESLESRRLLSGTWTTADSLPGGSTLSRMSAASDAAGNVFMAGRLRDAAGVSHNIIRMKPAGSDPWTTIADDVRPDDYYRLTATAGGDLYALHGRDVVKMGRSAGETAFRTIGTVPATLSNPDVAVDPSGTVYVSGNVTVKSGGSYLSHWTVQKLAGGGGSFVTVDDFTYSRSAGAEASGLTVVPSGPGAGVYVVGSAWQSGFQGGRNLVRRSTDGGLTWATVDDFLYDPATKGGGGNVDVAGDQAGNVYVTGYGYRGTVIGYDKRKQPIYGYFGDSIVRKSSNGGVSFSPDDVMQGSNDPHHPTATLLNVAVGPSGEVFTAGTISPTPYRGVVRTKTATGWQTVDDFQLSPGKSTVFKALTVDAGGNAFVGGYGLDASGAGHWLVRSPAAAATATFSATPIFADDELPSDEPTLAEELLQSAG